MVWVVMVMIWVVVVVRVLAVSITICFIRETVVCPVGLHVLASCLSFIFVCVAAVIYYLLRLY